MEQKINKWFDHEVTLHHLREGQVINPIEYVEQLKLFNQLGVRGTYITDKTYTPYSQTGFHYYNLTTLIKYFSSFKEDKVTIKYTNGKLSCEGDRVLYE